MRYAVPKPQSFNFRYFANKWLPEDNLRKHNGQ